MTTERKGTSNWVLFTAIGVGSIIGVVVLAFVAVSMLLPDWVKEFCLLVGALQSALEAGEDAIAAAEAFMDGFEDAMVDALPAEYQDTARLLVRAVLRVAEFIGGVIGAIVQPIVPAAAIERILDLIAQLDGVCGIVE